MRETNNHEPPIYQFTHIVLPATPLCAHRPPELEQAQIRASIDAAGTGPDSDAARERATHAANLESTPEPTTPPPRYAAPTTTSRSRAKSIELEKRRASMLAAQREKEILEARVAEKIEEQV